MTVTASTPLTEQQQQERREWFRERWERGVEFNRRCAMRMRRWDPEGIEVVLPYTDELSSHEGVFHGGVISALIDTAGGGAVIAGHDFGKGSRLSTVSMSIQYLLPASGAEVVAAARCVRRGGRVHFAEVEVSRSDGNVCARGQVVVSIAGERSNVGEPIDPPTHTRRTALSEHDDLVLYDVDPDGVATVTLNRPERRNAWSIPMERRFFAVLDQAAADPDVRVVVVTGAGKSFCPGMDVQRLEQNSQPGQSLNLSERVPMYSRRTLPKPMIAAINGGCAGIGLVQALICDVRFAARGARFTTAFARRGLAGEYNLPYVLPRVVGLENALDLLLSGRTFDADEAKDLGLVSRVVEPDQLLDAARAYARDIAVNCSPRAVAVMRHQVYGDLDRGFTEALGRSYSAMEYFAGSADFREGVASFTEKRAPKFDGLPAGFDPEEATRDAFLPY